MAKIKIKKPNDFAQGYFFGILLGIMLGAAFMHECNEVRNARRYLQQTKVEEVIDTTKIRQPEPIASDVVRHDTIKVPAFRYITKYETTDKLMVDTICTVDSVYISLPITQKEYGDSTYKAWVSGYNPALDSIEVYSRTITRSIIEKDAKRWGVGVTTGIGYNGSKISPYIGIGVTYNILKW